MGSRPGIREDSRPFLFLHVVEGAQPDRHLQVLDRGRGRGTDARIAERELANVEPAEQDRFIDTKMQPTVDELLQGMEDENPEEGDAPADDVDAAAENELVVRVRTFRPQSKMDYMVPSERRRPSRGGDKKRLAST